LGIDIGGTFTKFGLVDEKGIIYYEGSISTDRYEKIADYITELNTSVSKSFDPGKFKIMGVGIGAPNGNYYTGKIDSAPNLPWKGSINLTKLFEDAFHLPVKVTNDANAAALGEMLYGDAIKMKNFIMITLGTGLGSGIVVNGKLVYGHDGFAGELGHTIVDLKGRKCACGRRGCLETYVSAPGIKRTVFELLANETQNSELRKYSFESLNSKLISEAAGKGDEIALKAFDYTGKILGLKLADAVAHTSPEAIFLFGGLSKAGDLIFSPTKKYLDKYLLGIYSGKIKLLPSKLQNKNIAVMGAAALMWKELMS